MNRVAFAYALEFDVAWPQSAAGRDVKSDHATDMFDVPIEEDSRPEPDESIEGLTRIEKIAQASVWRRVIDESLTHTGREVMRMLYCDNAGRKEIACSYVGRHIAAKTGASQGIAINECRHEAALDCIDHHNHAAREMLLDLIRSATRKADRVLG